MYDNPGLGILGGVGLEELPAGGLLGARCARQLAGGFALGLRLHALQVAHRAVLVGGAGVEQAAPPGHIHRQLPTWDTVYSRVECRNLF